MIVAENGRSRDEHNDAEENIAGDRVDEDDVAVVMGGGGLD